MSSTSGPSPASRPLTPKQAEAQALRAEGMSYQAIAELLGITQMAAWHRCNPERYSEQKKRWYARHRARARGEQ